MSELSIDIYQYYMAHFDELPTEKQFHFASRLYLWCQDKAAKEKLENLREWCIPGDNPDAVLKGLAERPIDNSMMNAPELRLPMLARYPNLQHYNAVLFRILFMRTLYGIHAKSHFFSIFNRQEVQELQSKLLNDPEAIAVLSTYAINFLYLMESEVSGGYTVPADKLFELGRTSYDTSDSQQLQLLIYLYTHCVIAASNFYHRPLPEKSRTVYIQMLKELELHIDKQFTNVHLDNKFEFLVCCAIAARKTHLQERIMEEAERSISERGTFLIDRHNTSGQLLKRTLPTSEHRNVLFILANRSFTPLGK